MVRKNSLREALGLVVLIYVSVALYLMILSSFMYYMIGIPAYISVPVAIVISWILVSLAIWKSEWIRISFKKVK